MNSKAIIGLFILCSSLILPSFFNVKPVKSVWILSETIWINPDGSVEPLDAPISRQGNLYILTNDIYVPTGMGWNGIEIGRNNMTIDGNGFTIFGEYAIDIPNVGVIVTRDNVTIRNLKIDGFSSGINVHGSINVTVCDCIIINSEEISVGIWDSSNCHIFRNNLSFARDWGIWLGSSANNNEIFENIVYNSIGVYEHTGNRIWHNSILFMPSFTLNSSNWWDNGCEGNYWGDYEDRYPNASYDIFGIWNTPYIIDINNVDNYPLRNPYWSISDVNHDLQVNIFDVVLICIAYYSTPIDPNWSCHIDIAEPYEIIDIFDITSVTANYGENYNP